MDKIAAVIVTFNRIDLLKECLDGVTKQSTPLDMVFIVDNNSSDGTPEYLKEKYSQNPQFELCLLEENTGGAGGFYTGVKKAFEAGFDWIWLMDDDVEPKEDCLEILLKYGDRSKCIHPSKFYTETGQRHRWYGQVDPSSGRSLRAKDDGFSDPNTTFLQVNIGCFEGMLIHRDIIQKIGYPDPRFFIVDDDLVYGFLASHYTNVYYLRDAIFHKKIIKEQLCSFLGIKRPFQSPFTLYFNVRNQFLKKEYFKKYKEYNLLLNNSFIFLKSFKLIIESFLFFRSKKHIKSVFLGLLDGLRSQYRGHIRLFFK